MEVAARAHQDGVVARAAVERVVARAAVDGVVARTAHDDVGHARAREGVIKRRAEDALDADEDVVVGTAAAEVDVHAHLRAAVVGGIKPFAAVQRVTARATRQDVVARAAVEGVHAVAAAQHVVAVLAEQGVGPGTADENVIARAADDVVVAAEAVEDVVAAETRQEVVAVVGDDDVAELRALDVLDAVEGVTVRAGATREVDGDACTGGREDDQIRALAAEEAVRAVAAHETVVAEPAVEDVVVRVAFEVVVEVRAGEIGDADELIAFRVTRADEFVAREADAHALGGSLVGGDADEAVADIEDVRARAADQDVYQGVGEQVVAALAAVQGLEVDLEVGGENVIVLGADDGLDAFEAAGLKGGEIVFEKAEAEAAIGKDGVVVEGAESEIDAAEAEQNGVLRGFAQDEAREVHGVVAFAADDPVDGGRGVVGEVQIVVDRVVARAAVHEGGVELDVDGVVAGRADGRHVEGVRKDGRGDIVTVVERGRRDGADAEEVRAERVAQVCHVLSIPRDHYRHHSGTDSQHRSLKRLVPHGAQSGRRFRKRKGPPFPFEWRIESPRSSAPSTRPA